MIEWLKYKLYIDIRKITNVPNIYSNFSEESHNSQNSDANSNLFTRNNFTVLFFTSHVSGSENSRNMNLCDKWQS